MSKDPPINHVPGVHFKGVRIRYIRDNEPYPPTLLWFDSPRDGYASKVIIGGVVIESKIPGGDFPCSRIECLLDTTEVIPENEDGVPEITTGPKLAIAPEEDFEDD